MRLMIAAGGTGGHVYPALAVAEALRQHRSNADSVVFVGTVGGFERPLVEQAAFPFKAYHEVLAGPLHGIHPLRALVSLVKLALGTLQALALIIRHRPQALLLTGGWVGLPVALAAWLLRVPALIYLPDVEPGLAIRVLKRFARKVAITVPESARYFRQGQTIVTGYPLRQAMLEAATEEGRQRGVAHFGLDPARKTVFVHGGSRGARSINSALLAILPDLLADGVQVLHVTGTLDWERVQAEQATMPEMPHYHAHPYLHDMGLGFAVADLVVCRAGASVLGELPLFGVPSILVPYPHAWRYQKVNADFLTEHDAAVRMNDEAMAEMLLPTIRNLLSDPAHYTALQTHAQALAQPDGAWHIGEELLRLGGGAAWSN